MGELLSASRGWTKGLLRSIKWRKKTWAERQQFPISKLGTTVDGVELSNDGRVSAWVDSSRRSGLEDLVCMQSALKVKGVRSVIAGVFNANAILKYALFK